MSSSDMIETAVDLASQDVHILGQQPAKRRLQAPFFTGPDDMDPVHDWVLTQQLPKTMTRGGLYLPEPDDDNEHFISCFVWKVGPGRTSEYGFRPGLSCKPGDIVYLSHRPVRGFFIFDTEDGNERYWMVRDLDFGCIASKKARSQFEAEYPEMYQKLATLQAAS